MPEAIHELNRLSYAGDESTYDSLAGLRSIGRELERNIRTVLRTRDLSIKELKALRVALQEHDRKMERAGRVLSDATAWTGLCDRAAGIAWGFSIGAMFVILLGMLN